MYNSTRSSLTSSSSSDEVETKRYVEEAFLYKDSNLDTVCKRNEQKYNSICKNSLKNFVVLQADENQENCIPVKDFPKTSTLENVNINSETESCDLRSDQNQDIQHEGDQEDCYISDALSDRDFNYENNANNADSESVYANSLNNSFESSESSSNENEGSIFDKIMFDTSKLSVRDIILMCTAFALRFNISDQALLMLHSMFQFCAGPNFSNLNLSKHMLKILFLNQEILNDVLKNITTNSNEFKGLIHKQILAEFDQDNKKVEYLL
ncbi:hypothetical protein TSAR_016288, partial [Trichomalopsis sarcophagae]